jgi:hypothetical protein
MMERGQYPAANENKIGNQNIWSPATVNSLPYRRFGRVFGPDRTGNPEFSDSDHIPKLIIPPFSCRLDCVKHSTGTSETHVVVDLSASSGVGMNGE